MKINEILEKIEDWKRDLFLCECDSSDPNYHRLEYIKAVLEKYQKIEEIMSADLEHIHPTDRDKYRVASIKEVLEDGNL